MPFPAVVGGTIQCSFGAVGTLGGAPTNKVLIEGKPALTIMDNVPFLNITPMGMCISPANPSGMGKPVPTPTACTPIPLAPWAPPIAPTKLVANKPILLVGSVCMCSFGGVIQIVNPGAFKEQVS